MFGVVVISALVAPVHAQDLSGYGLEELAEIPVVRSSKESERLFDAPATAFVFDEDAISFLPVDSVPELLRYAPGVHINRATNGIWGLGIRGMSSRFLGRVLFTVDEQNIYNTLYAGLFGSQHDLFFPDIASVEVVYGPGGSLWGTNAVNGMVNVIMKSTFDTEDTLALLQVGSMNRNIGVRSGWSIDSNTSARVFAKASLREASVSPTEHDRWKTLRVGFQLDHRYSSRDLITLSSEVYCSDLGWNRNYGNPQTGAIEILDRPEKQSGVNAQAKWTRQIDPNNGFTVRTWVGYTEMDSGYVEFDLGIAGTELRARFDVTDTHQFVFTLGGTLEKYDLKDTAYSIFHEDYRGDSFTFHSGAEYTWTLAPERWDLSLGLNYQHESHTESAALLPSIRLIHRPDNRTRIWASFSRAARPVVAGINDVKEILLYHHPIDPVVIPTPQGNVVLDHNFIFSTSGRDLVPEKLDAFELGLRRQIHSRFTLGINLYHYRYRNVFGAVLLDSVPVLNVAHPYLKTINKLINAASGTGEGFEFTSAFELSEHTSITLNLALLRDDFEPTLEAPNFLSQMAVIESVDIVSNSDPEQLASMWWTQRWTSQLRTDLGLRFSGGYKNTFGERKEIWQSDLKASWEPHENFRLSLVGRNLLQSRTQESPLRDMLSLPTEQPREWYLEIQYQF